MSEVAKTSEAPKETTLADIQQQYTALCNKAGHIQYQIRTFQKDLDMINDTLRNLNLQAAALQAKAQQAEAEKALAQAKAAQEAAQPAQEVKSDGQ